MANDDNQDRERAARDRIASFMQADEPVQSDQATDEELQTLRVAPCVSINCQGKPPRTSKPGAPGRKKKKSNRSGLQSHVSTSC